MAPATAGVRVGGSRVLGPWGSSFPLPCRLRGLQPTGYACPLNQESQLQHRRPFLIRNPGGCLDPKRKPTGRHGLLPSTSSLREAEADWGPRLQIRGGARASRSGAKRSHASFPVPPLFQRAYQPPAAARSHTRASHHRAQAAAMAGRPTQARPHPPAHPSSLRRFVATPTCRIARARQRCRQAQPGRSSFLTCAGLLSPAPVWRDGGWSGGMVHSCECGSRYITRSRSPS